MRKDLLSYFILILVNLNSIFVNLNMLSLLSYLH